ncbi:MAG: ATP-binding protein [Halobacteriota archaeon]
MAESIEHLAVSADGFTLPVEDVLMGRGFITGKSGSGKSNTASVIVEELLDRNLGVLIVDTEGEYAGLKSAYDVLHVGADEDCDMDVSADDADQLVAHALDDLTPILLDISTYPDEDVTEDVLHAVVHALFVAEQRKRIPFLLLVEEAHEFIPQSGGSSELKSLLVRVAKRGRKRGLGICCMSQRPAAVDKEYITQCNWFVWHRLTWENDTAVVDRILGGDSADSVQTLGDGEAIVMTDWSESIDRVQFRRKRTDDAGSTPSIEALYDATGEGASAVGESTSTSTSSSSSSSENDPQSGTPVDADAAEPEQAASGSTRESAAPGSSRDSAIAGSSRDRTVGSDPFVRSIGSRSFAGRKPSLSRRRQRRSTPGEGSDSIWELGSLVVYLYDTVVWWHLYVVFVLETNLRTAVERFERAAYGTALPRRPGPYERYAYRLVAVLGVIIAYAIVASVIVRLT